MAVGMVGGLERKADRFVGADEEDNPAAVVALLLMLVTTLSFTKETM